MAFAGLGFLALALPPLVFAAQSLSRAPLAAPTADQRAALAEFEAAWRIGGERGGRPSPCERAPSLAPMRRQVDALHRRTMRLPAGPPIPSYRRMSAVGPYIEGNGTSLSRRYTESCAR